MVNADCNLDGKIDDDDIDLIRDFIENGYNTDTLSDKLGDINGDGVVSAADLRILADYILGVKITVRIYHFNCRKCFISC